METKKIVIYLRRSKKESSEAQASLIAQTKAAKNLIEHRFTKAEVIAIYVELESGTATKRDKRTEIRKAIAHTMQEQDCRLVIAKVDRLSRDVGFTSMLYENKIPFICCDNPDANEFTIKLFTLTAEKEAKDISERTKKGLDVKKSLGVALGCHAHKEKGNKLSHISRLHGASSMREKWRTKTENKQGQSFAQSLRSQGKTVREIASIMNESGFTSPSGGVILPQTISRWLKNATQKLYQEG